MYKFTNNIVVRSAALPKRVAQDLLIDEQPVERAYLLFKSNVDVRNAIRMTSPSLYKSLRLGNHGGDAGLTLLKYVLRMSCRPTPFGLFAGIQEVKSSDQTRIVRDSIFDLYVKPNSVTGESLNSNVFSVNASIFRMNGRIHNFYGEYSTSSVKSNPLIEKYISLLSSKRSDLTDSDLVETLREIVKRDVTEMEVRKIVSPLKEQGFIMDSSESPSKIAGRYKKFAVRSHQDDVEKIIALQNYIDRDCSGKYFIDMVYRGKSSELSRQALGEIAELGEVMCCISNTLDVDQSKEIATRMTEKYGISRVPILEATDDQFGLGILNDFTIGTVQDNDKKKRFLELFIGSIKRGVDTIDLNENDVVRLGINPGDMIPDSLDIVVRIIKNKKSGELEYWISPTLGAEHIGKVNGRLHYLLSKDYLDELAACVSLCSPDHINVEMQFNMFGEDYINLKTTLPIDLPQLHLGYAKKSDGADFINLDDLTLDPVRGLCLNANESSYPIRIWNFNMLNPFLWPKFSRFLFRLSNKPRFGLINTYFDSFIIESLVKLPRIKYKNFVICPTRWYMQRELLDNARTRKFGVWDSEILCWIEKYDVPSVCYFSSSDKRILLNLNHADFRLLLYREIRKDGGYGVFLEEVPTGEDIVYDAWGDEYASEIVVGLYRETPRLSNTGVERIPLLSPFTRRFLIALDDQLYLKIYTHPENYAAVLKHFEHLLENKNFSHWYYVLYQDPKHHIRIRLYSNSINDFLPDIRDMIRDLVNRGLLSDYSIHSFDREIDRYGADEQSFILCEKIFHCSSLEAIKAMGHKDDDVKLNVLWSITYILLHALDKHAVCGFLGRYVARNEIDPLLYREIRKKHMDKYVEYVSGFTADQHLKSLFDELKEMIPNDYQSVLSSILHMHCNRLGLSVPSERRYVYIISRLYDSWLHITRSDR